MRAARASRTAVMVCMGRAAAHGLTRDEQFSDPTALRLLGEPERQLVQRFRDGAAPQGVVERFRYAHLARESPLVVARTIAIDQAVASTQAPQLVLLGAGLDGRAWRMASLEGCVVFEVDHPASQHDKRSRSEGLELRAREVRFVPVDFQHDDLAAQLEAAGHDPQRPTTWVWEGVVMYLHRRDIEATLQVVQARSAPGSRLIIAYHQPALMLLVLALIVYRLGEPIRSVFRPRAMRALLARHGFRVDVDEDAATIGARLSREVARATRPMKHLRVAVAERVPPGTLASD